MDYGFPPVEPYTELSDDRLLLETLRVRSQHGDLCSLSKSELESWVRDRLPGKVRTLESCALDDVNEEATRIVDVPYAELVHNRAAVDPDRVASIVRLLLHEPNVDSAVIEVQRLDSLSWRSTLDAADVSPTNPLRAGTWYVLSGNHRAVAQNLLGIGVFAYARTQPARTYHVSFGGGR